MIWPVFGGGCHPNRETEAAISAAGFEIEECRRFDFQPCFIRAPSAPHLGSGSAPLGAFCGGLQPPRAWRRPPVASTSKGRMTMNMGGAMLIVMVGMMTLMMGGMVAGTGWAMIRRRARRSSDRL